MNNPFKKLKAMREDGKRKVENAPRSKSETPVEASIPYYKDIPMKERLKRVLWLALTFLKIGAFTFGGGYAMISLIEKDVVDKRKWLSTDEMLDVIAIAEATPGTIALNMATYVGAKVCGFWGALAASICVLLPAFLIIIAISTVLNKFGNNRYVKWAFLGIRACVCALILNAVWKFFKAIKKGWYSYIIMGVAFVLATLSSFEIIKFDVIFIILIAAVFGVVFNYCVRKYKKKKSTPVASQAGESQTDLNQVEDTVLEGKEPQTPNDGDENVKEEDGQ